MCRMVSLSNAPSMENEPPLREFQLRFAEEISRDSRLEGGRVLDVGCGPRPHRAMRFIKDRCAQLDGVDLGDEVLQNPYLQARWHSPFESAPIPESAYDLAFAYNVVEHIAEPRPFFEKLARVLKPGGAFYALTPHRNHPFALMSRAAEVAGLKRAFAARLEGVNDYSAYYRLNSRGSIRRAIAGMDLQLTGTWYVQAPGWEQGYFPRALQALPRLYDRLLGGAYPILRPILLYRLERPASDVSGKSSSGVLEPPDPKAADLA